jgi:hypothetical protein
LHDDDIALHRVSMKNLPCLDSIQVILPLPRTGTRGQ